MLQAKAFVNIVNGRDRYTATVAFNERFYRIRGDAQSALFDVAHVPRLGRHSIPREANALSKLVAYYLATSKWVATFGLSYLDTMQLTYAEWIRMQKLLNTISQQNPDDQPE